MSELSKQFLDSILLLQRSFDVLKEEIDKQRKELTEELNKKPDNESLIKIIEDIDVLKQILIKLKEEIDNIDIKKTEYSIDIQRYETEVQEIVSRFNELVTSKYQYLNSIEDLNTEFQEFITTTKENVELDVKAFVKRIEESAELKVAGLKIYVDSSQSIMQNFENSTQEALSEMNNKTGIVLDNIKNISETALKEIDQIITAILSSSQSNLLKIEEATNSLISSSEEKKQYLQQIESDISTKKDIVFNDLNISFEQRTKELMNKIDEYDSHMTDIFISINKKLQFAKELEQKYKEDKVIEEYGSLVDTVKAIVNKIQVMDEFTRYDIESIEESLWQTNSNLTYLRDKDTEVLEYITDIVRAFYKIQDVIYAIAKADNQNFGIVLSNIDNIFDQISTVDNKIKNTKIRSVTVDKDKLKLVTKEKTFVTKVSQKVTNIFSSSYGGGGNNQSTTYTNLTKTTKKIGSLEKGSHFNGADITSVLDAILYGWINPDITDFSTDMKTNFELGEESNFNGNISFKITQLNFLQVDTIMYTIIDEDYVKFDLVDAVEGDNTKAISTLVAYKSDVPLESFMSISAMNNKQIGITRYIDVRWSYIVYFGNSDLISSDSLDIVISTANKTYTNKLQDITFDAPLIMGYKYLFIPSNIYDQNIIFKEAIYLNQVNFTILLDKHTITNDFGIDIDYVVLCSEVQYEDEFKIVVDFT